MVRIVSNQFLLLLAALVLCSQVADAQLLAVEVSKTEGEEVAEETDSAAEESNMIEEETSMIASEAPSDTIAPSSDATTATTTIREQDTECDAMERAFAPSCCPLEDPSFAEFCEALFDRSHEVSTGMLEAHEPWIGGYGIASILPEGRKRQL